MERMSAIIGTQVTDCKTTAEAIIAAGLDTPVELRRVLVASDTNTSSECDFKKAVVRKADDRVLGIVGNGYQPIQNIECFNFLDSIIGEGRAKLYSAGTTDNGRALFITLSLGLTIIGNPQLGDEIERRITLTSSHDGSSSMKIHHTALRLVCLNGLTTHKSIGNVSIRHSKNYRGKIDPARELLKLSDSYYTWFEERCKTMAETKFTKADMIAFSEKIIPDTLSDGKPKQSTRKENIRASIVNLFDNGAGNFGLSAWHAYNAVTEYADHVRTYGSRTSRSAAEARYIGTLYGSGASLKNAAFNLLTA